MLPSFEVDMTNVQTEMCLLGKIIGIDKSPYNTVRHRHPYTGFYSMLFSKLQSTPTRFVEIGIAGGGSAHLWNGYFRHPDTKIWMYDRDEDYIRHADEELKQVPGGHRFTFSKMDVSVDGDIAKQLEETKEWFDVIIDDSSHEFDHQIRICKESMPFIRQGGLMIVEDVFRETSEKKYFDALQAAGVLSQCSFAYFVITNHVNRWSPGWNNDKLLVLVKG